MAEQNRDTAQSHDINRVRERTQLPSRTPYEESPPSFGEKIALERAVGNSALDVPVERHAKLLSDPRLSQPANEAQKTRFMSQIQCSYGNAYAQRLLISRAVQAKLTVNPPADQYEKEADRISDTISRMSDYQIQRQQATGELTESEKETEAMFPGESERSKASAQAMEKEMKFFFRNPKSAKQDHHLLANTPEGIKHWEDMGKNEGPYWVEYTIMGKPTERRIDSGTKIQNLTFIMELSPKHKEDMKWLAKWDRKGDIVYLNQDQGTVRCLDEPTFFKNVQIGQMAEEISKNTEFVRAVLVAYQYGTVTVMLVVRPDLLIDAAGNIIAGKSIVDEEAMRGYLATLLTGPLSKIKTGKVVKIIVDDILVPAVQSGFKQVLEKGKIENPKTLQAILEGAFSNEVGKAISKLPRDSQSLLEKKFGSEKVREKIGAVITMEVTVGWEATKEAVHSQK